MANIFGKKSFNEKEKGVDELIEDSQPTDQKFTEKGSMIDYFKNKLAAKRGTKPCYKDLNNSESSGQEFGSDTDNTYHSFGTIEIGDIKSDDDDICAGFGFQHDTEVSNIAQKSGNANDENVDNSKKNRKRLKIKPKILKGNNSELIDDVNDNESDDIHNLEWKKENKLEQNVNKLKKATQNLKTALQFRKKKSKNNNIECEENEQLETDPCDQLDELPFIHNSHNNGTEKKKRKKNSEQVILDETDVAPKKKKKKYI